MTKLVVCRLSVVLFLLIESVVFSQSTGTDRVPVLDIDQSTSNPWTHLRLNNKPGNFQFAIVSDRNGGQRPGVFEDAVRKLNLLSPEFVMSVGDFIPGYTDSRPELTRQWNEFLSIVEKLKMPFFCVPGNHDLSNPVERQVWNEHFGRSYYHFVYGDVLFLCIASDDPLARLSQEQLAYFRDVLEKNKNVRWTIGFLHRPLWIESDKGTNRASKLPDDLDHEPGAPTDNGWPEIERMLEGRPHTIFAGHLHDYTLARRNGDNKYFILSTTGGGSALRGALNYGQFDQVVWCTMTDEGPVIANIELSGIWDENVRTVEVTRLVNMAIGRSITTERLMVDVPFTKIPTKLRLTNDSDIPLTLTVGFDKHPGFDLVPPRFEVGVPPNSNRVKEIMVIDKGLADASQVTTPITLHYTASMELPGKPPINVDSTRVIEVEPRFAAEPASRNVKIDGKTAEWGRLELTGGNSPNLVRKRQLFKGEKDCSWQMSAFHDEENIYVALSVKDDTIVIDRNTTNPLAGDCVELFLTDAQDWTSGSVPVKVLSKKARKRNPRVARLPENTVSAAVSANGKSHRSNDSEVRSAAVLVPGGYQVEFAVPKGLIEWPDKELTAVRLNIAVHDFDQANRRANKVLWWRPDWRGITNLPGSGTFLLK